MDMSINFPNLHIYLEHVGKSISIFGFKIAFYGMIIAFGMLMGIVVARAEARKTHQDPELYLDLAIYAIIFSVIGARLYYVAFSWDMYKNNLISILYTRQGGLAIYGGVIAAILTTYIFARVKKVNFYQLLDTACLGLILGQIIGRWGNFFNREAFGGYTNNLFAMQLPVDAVRSSDITTQLANHIKVIDGVSYIQVHPTFLYESLWNVMVLLIILFVKRFKQFQGEVFLLYLLGYGIGRFWIEGLRTDQLIMPIVHYPASQALAAFLAIVSFLIIVIGHIRVLKRKKVHKEMSK